MVQVGLRQSFLFMMRLHILHKVKDSFKSKTNMQDLSMVVKRLLKEVRSNRRFMADSQLQWKLADAVYSFTKRIEDDGYIFANFSEALARDVGMSKSQLNYLMKFRTRYPSIDQVSKEINWSKYRELMDFPDGKSRKQCETLILQGKIKSDTEIREFKRRIKAGMNS